MGSKRKIPDKVKIRAVNELLTGKKTRAQVCAEYRATYGMLGRWEEKFKDEALRFDASAEPVNDTEAVSTERMSGMRGKGKRTDDATKAKAVADHEARNGTNEAIAARYNVSVATLSSWVKKRKSGASVASVVAASGVGANAAALVIGQAIRKMYEVPCPHCGQVLEVQPPGYTETLVTVGYHLLNGVTP